MKCCSRSTLGVIIGTLNILGYLSSIIIVIVSLVHFDALTEDLKSSKNGTAKIENKDPFGLSDDGEEDEVLKEIIKAFGKVVLVIVLVVSLAMVILSALLIMGIVKRRHSLMVPWLVVSAIGFVLSCLSGLLKIFGFFLGVHWLIVLQKFIVDVIVLGIEALILYPIYTLYKDIRNRNNVPIGQVFYSNASPAQANYYTAVPEKSKF